jgi:hypothetical protein
MTTKTDYVFDGYDELETITPSPPYKVKSSQMNVWKTIQQTHGLTTVLRLENGELTSVTGKAEIIGVYDPSISQHQFRSDIL